MKFDRGAIGTLIAVFVWCMVMGIFVISVGIGSVVPAINSIAKPLVCPAGQFSYQQVVSNPYPGGTFVTGSWTCTDAGSGSQRQFGLVQLGMIVGPFYGLLIFLLVLRPWYQFTLSSQKSKAAEADWQRKWNAEFGKKGSRNQGS